MDKNKDNRPLDQIQLLCNEEDTLVCVTPGSTPFPLPPIPKTMTDFIACFLERVWYEHRRGASALLLLDRTNRAWTFAVPQQTCSSTGSYWSIARRDLPDIPQDLVLSGTFQSSMRSASDDPADIVPHVNGVHFVLTIEEDEARSIWSYLRAGDQLKHVPAAQVILDELQLVFDTSRHLLTFA